MDRFSVDSQRAPHPQPFGHPVALSEPLHSPPDPARPGSLGRPLRLGSCGQGERISLRQQPLPAGLETDTPSGLGRGRVAVGSAPSSAPRTRHHFPGDASGNLRRSTWSAGGSPGTSKALPTALEKSRVLKRGRTAHTTAPERGRQERVRGLSFSFGCTTRSPHS